MAPRAGRSRCWGWAELSSIAVHAFFEENSYIPRHVAQEKFDRWEVGGIRLLCGEPVTGKRSVRPCGAVSFTGP